MNLEAQSVSFIRHCVLTDLTPGALVSVRSDLLLHIAINFLCFICLCAFACNIVELMVGLELIQQDNLYLFVHMRTVLGQV
jgi:hypothetical protein